MATFRVVQGSLLRTEKVDGYHVERTDDDGTTEIVSQLYSSKKHAQADADGRNAKESDPHA